MRLAIRIYVTFSLSEITIPKFKFRIKTHSMNPSLKENIKKHPNDSLIVPKSTLYSLEALGHPETHVLDRLDAWCVPASRHDVFGQSFAADAAVCWLMLILIRCNYLSFFLYFRAHFRVVCARLCMLPK